MVDYKKCKSQNITKNGIVRKKQKYLCKECGYNFVIGNAYNTTAILITFANRFPPQQFQFVGFITAEMTARSVEQYICKFCDIRMAIDAADGNSINTAYEHFP